MMIKYFIGPMSKNVVDAIIDFCNETNNYIGLIPSRRQIEYNGGYVNNWTTKDFSMYVNNKTDKITLQRDHSGPGQGQQNDNGFISLIDDCKYLDLIHIDPWKKYSEYADGLEWTVEMIKVCNAINPNIRFEVGTEEAIKRFEVEDLNRLILDLKRELSIELFNKIKYLVIQSGTSLKGNTQTGQYDKNRLVEMINLAKKYNLLSKEHNGDYIPVSTIHEKFKLGLDAINIAPEFGLIETQCYLDVIESEDTLNEFWKICYDSKKWVKWVTPEFDAINNKVELIKICGHYVISDTLFLGIKEKFPYINEIIKNKVIDKLTELYGNQA
jgi:hypothetical protein